MLFAVAVFCLLFFFTTRISPCGVNIDIERLSLINTLPLRGMLVITIFLHHLYCNAGLTYPIFKSVILPHLGYLCVSVYLLLSGYGLQVQFINRGDSYLLSLRKKCIFILWLYLMINILYAFASPLYSDNSFTEIVMDCSTGLFNGHPVAGSSWYLLDLMALYIAFLVASKCKHNILVLISLVALLGTIYYFAGFGSIWALSNLSFPVGVMLARTQDKINNFNSKTFVIYCLVITIVMLIIGIISLALRGQILEHILKSFVAATFAVIVILSYQNIRVISSLWSIIGKYSLELFLMHPLIMKILRGGWFYIGNDVLYITMCGLLTFTISLALHNFNDRIKMLFYKI